MTGAVEGGWQLAGVGSGGVVAGEHMLDGLVGLPHGVCRRRKGRDPADDQHACSARGYGPSGSPVHRACHPRRVECAPHASTGKRQQRKSQARQHDAIGDDVGQRRSTVDTSRDPDRKPGGDDVEHGSREDRRA